MKLTPFFRAGAPVNLAPIIRKIMAWFIKISWREVKVLKCEDFSFRVAFGEIDPEDVSKIEEFDP